MDSLDSMEGNSHRPILLENGQYETFLVKIGGGTFHCEVCGSNCFHKYYDEPDVYHCNGCESVYRGQ